MGNLTVEQVQCLLELIETRYGRGYSAIPQVGALQAKLSILLEMAHRLDLHSSPIPHDPPETPKSNRNVAKRQK